MNAKQMATVIAYVQENWPNTPMSKQRAEIFALELGDLAYEPVITVLRGELAANEFPPTPARLRRDIAQTMNPLPDWDEVVDELATKVASVGQYQPEPGWSHEIIHAFVAQRGGWGEVCRSMPTRDLFDAHAASNWNTYAAQARDSYKALVGRAMRDEVFEGIALDRRVGAAFELGGGE